MGKETKLKIGNYVQCNNSHRHIWGTGMIVGFCQDGRAQVKFDLYNPCAELIYITPKYLEKVERRTQNDYNLSTSNRGVL